MALADNASVAAQNLQAYLYHAKLECCLDWQPVLQ